MRESEDEEQKQKINLPKRRVGNPKSCSVVEMNLVPGYDK